ncbi:O-antigen translocase [Mesorhizobium sp. CN2-181]|uniref:O-antigen translocase n=1 Tax=Mesorhizobium yinganensis TaxID=3157707 RepID=UPI0032B77C6D
MKSVTTGSEEAGARSASYLQIVKSTALIGGSSIVNIVFAVIRNKVIAVLLGPEGVGLMGLYNSIADLAQTLAGLGVQASGVRQVAEAAGTNEAERIARTGIVLNRVSIVLGVLGMLLLAAFALPVAELTFEDRNHTAGVVLLSAAVLLRIISAGQTALIQGLRRIGDLARITMWGAFWNTVVCVPIILVWRQEGVVPTILAMAFTTLAVSWWYSRRVEIVPVHVTARETRQETAVLLKLGFAFMGSAFLSVGAAYAIRIIVLRLDGIEAAGLYQAAWSIGGLYAGFILQAMGADFYPRLTAVHNDNDACNRLVNEQTQISILLAGPGLIATLTVAPLLMTVLYSSEFHAAVDLLRWICLGMMLRIVAWPIGYIVLAKGARWIFLFTEIAATVVHVGLAWFLVGQFGLVGAGIAFFGLYVWHGVLIYWISRRLSGFRWSGVNMMLAMAYLLAAALVLSAFYMLPPWQATAVGTLVVIVACFSSLRMLLKLLPREKLPLGRWLPQWV